MKTVTIGLFGILILAGVIGLADAPAPFPVVMDSQFQEAPRVEVYRGNGRTFRVTFKDNGVSSDLTNTVPFMHWGTNALAAGVSTSTWAFVGSSTGGVVDFTFTPAAVNYAGGRYVYEAGVMVDGSPRTYRQGVFQIWPSPVGAGVAAIDWTTRLDWNSITWTNLPEFGTDYTARSNAAIGVAHATESSNTVHGGFIRVAYDWATNAYTLAGSAWTQATNALALAQAAFGWGNHAAAGYQTGIGVSNILGGFSFTDTVARAGITTHSNRTDNPHSVTAAQVAALTNGANATFSSLYSITNTFDTNAITVALGVGCNATIAGTYTNGAQVLPNGYGWSIDIGGIYHPADGVQFNTQPIPGTWAGNGGTYGSGTILVSYKVTGTFTNQFITAGGLLNGSNLLAGSVADTTARAVANNASIVASNAANNVSTNIIYDAYGDGSGITAFNSTRRFQDYSIWLNVSWAPGVVMIPGQQFDIMIAYSAAGKVVTFPAGIKCQTTGLSLSATNTTGFTDWFTLVCRGTNATAGTWTTNLFVLRGIQ